MSKLSDLCCSFCWRNYGAVKKLLKSPSDINVYVCNYCIDDFMKRLKDEGIK